MRTLKRKTDTTKYHVPSFSLSFILSFSLFFSIIIVLACRGSTGFLMTRLGATQNDKWQISLIGRLIFMKHGARVPMHSSYVVFIHGLRYSYTMRANVHVAESRATWE